MELNDLKEVLGVERVKKIKQYAYNVLHYTSKWDSITDTVIFEATKDCAIRPRKEFYPIIKEGIEDIKKTSKISDFHEGYGD